MQKRKFDELISHFNRKVSDMGIDQKYKMELLGMISAIGFAHEKELSTNLASLGTDCISRQAAIDALKGCYCGGEDSCGEPWIYKENAVEAIQMIEPIPSAKPKRIRGKWIKYEQEFMLEGSLGTVQKTVRECSVCTAKIAGMVGIMNFCPNCGAKMEVSNESN